MSAGNGNSKARRNWGVIDPQLLDPHGAMHKNVSLPGYEGVPFRGSVPDLRTSDPEQLQPQFGQKVHIEILELWDTKQLERYREICQVVANGFGAVSKEDTQYDNSKKNWRVFIRWLEYYTTVEKGGSNGSSS